MGLDLCYEKLILILQIENIGLFFKFEKQKMVFYNLDLNPSGQLKVLTTPDNLQQTFAIIPAKLRLGTVHILRIAQKGLRHKMTQGKVRDVLIKS